MENLVTAIEWHRAENELPKASGWYLIVTPGGAFTSTTFSARNKRFFCTDYLEDEDLVGIEEFPVAYWAVVPREFLRCNLKK